MFIAWGIRVLFTIVPITSCFILLLIIYTNRREQFPKNVVLIRKFEEHQPEVKISEDTIALENLSNKYPVRSNKSYCKFHYGIPEDLTYRGKDLRFGPELGLKGSSRILYNVIEAQIPRHAPLVTYATHMTVEFVNYIPELARRWEGPISIAAYAPELDAAMVLEQVHQFCYCFPEMSKVSLHLVFPKNIQPSRKDMYFTQPTNCYVEDSSLIKSYRYFDEKVVYPVNVCRNAARMGAVTKHVIVSDIQLMPSEGMASRFLEMINRRKLRSITHNAYVVPIFEVDSNEKIPRTKTQLMDLIIQKKAVYFHGEVCSHCQRFPGIEKWMTTKPGNKVEPLVSVKREVPYNRWEPIYIGTRSDPLYNEVLSWEGLQDKMPQMLEMCLKNYNFVILDGAFLVHWPGIKKTAVMEEAWRTPYVTENMRQYNKIVQRLSRRYRSNQKCMGDNKSKQK